MTASACLLLIQLWAIISVVLLQTAFADPEDGYTVSQIHIAQGKAPEFMTVSWVTETAASSQVKFGTSPAKMDRLAVGESTQYEYSYYEYEYYRSGVIHHVQLNDLEPGTTYFYQCGDVDSDNLSGLLMFKTSPSVGSEEKYTFGVVGDLGQTADSESTLEHMLENKDISMVLHAGDLSYADCQQTLWDSYAVMVQNLAQERPWMVGPGNHEIELNAEGSMFLALEQRYRMPAIKPAEFGSTTIPAAVDSSTGNPYCASSVFQVEYNYGNSFYSFEVASAHVIYLNPYSTTNETSVQYQWLEQDLKAVDRSITPWVIAIMHCPWYSSNMGHYEEEQTVLMREAMEPLFYKYHVNIAFTGHVHAYERTFPLYSNATQADGVVYVTIGDGGNHEGHSDQYYAQPEWSAFRNGTQYGHGEVELRSSREMVWKWLRNVDGEIIFRDEVRICNTAFGGSATCEH